jgi:hypothetical protein
MGSIALLAAATRLFIPQQLQQQAMVPAIRKSLVDISVVVVVSSWNDVGGRV